MFVSTQVEGRRQTSKVVADSFDNYLLSFFVIHFLILIDETMKRLELTVGTVNRLLQTNKKKFFLNKKTDLTQTKNDIKLMYILSPITKPYRNCI